jgi:acylphosphatase
MTGKSVRVSISGRVQGVGYRAWMARRASDLGLKGWVRNRADGSVEAVLSGPEETVDTMIELSRRGPRLSAVTTLETSPVAAEDWPDFSVRPTA